MILILDLDGTLIDSTARHYILMERILKQYFQEGRISEDTVSSFHAGQFMDYKAGGNSGKKYLTEYLHLDDQIALDVMKQWGENIESEEMLELDCLYSEAMDFLQRRQQKGDTLIFLTARKNREGLQKELQRLAIKDYASRIIVVSPSNAMQEKTDAVRTLRKDMHNSQEIPAMEITKDSRKILIVGDTENEWSLSGKLGLDCYLLHRGFRNQAFWDAKGVITHENLLEL